MVQSRNTQNVSHELFWDKSIRFKKMHLNIGINILAVLSTVQ